MDEYIKVVIAGLFECYQTWSERKQKATLSKIQALSELLITNRVYLRDYSHQGKSDPLQEADLAKEWKRVGILFYDIYPQLSALCENKSDYWVYPGEYSKRKVSELGITIRNLELQYRNAKQKFL